MFLYEFFWINRYTVSKHDQNYIQNISYTTLHMHTGAPVWNSEAISYGSSLIPDRQFSMALNPVIADTIRHH